MSVKLLNQEINYNFWNTDKAGSRPSQDNMLALHLK